jgi:hypothetical protein
MRVVDAAPIQEHRYKGNEQRFFPTDEEVSAKDCSFFSEMIQYQVNGKDCDEQWGLFAELMEDSIHDPIQVPSDERQDDSIPESAIKHGELLFSAAA